MTEREFWITIGRLSGQEPELVEVCEKMIKLLDGADYEDIYGTEGWRHYLGWD